MLTAHGQVFCQHVTKPVIWCPSCVVNTQFCVNVLFCLLLPVKHLLLEQDDPFLVCIDQHWRFAVITSLPVRRRHKMNFAIFSEWKFPKVERMFFTPSWQPLIRFVSNLASLLSDSFSQESCVQISFFVFEKSVFLYRKGWWFVSPNFYCSLKKNKGTCKKSETQFFSGRCQ